VTGEGRRSSPRGASPPWTAEHQLGQIFTCALHRSAIATGHVVRQRFVTWRSWSSWSSWSSWRSWRSTRASVVGERTRLAVMPASRGRCRSHPCLFLRVLRDLRVTNLLRTTPPHANALQSCAPDHLAELVLGGPRDAVLASRIAPAPSSSVFSVTSVSPTSCARRHHMRMRFSPAHRTIWPSWCSAVQETPSSLRASPPLPLPPCSP